MDKTQLLIVFFKFMGLIKEPNESHIPSQAVVIFHL